VVMPMILPQVMQLLPQACCLHVLNQVGIRWRKLNYRSSIAMYLRFSMHEKKRREAVMLEGCVQSVMHFGQAN
jgi:hypothetical protein